jgi:spermidine synthase
LPVTARFIPGDLWAQVGRWTLYWLATLGPFLCGATFLGAALTTAGPRVGRVYAANLFGSGSGAAVAVLLVSRFALEQWLWPSLGLTCLAALLLLRAGRDRPAAALLLIGLILTIEWRWPLRPAYEEFKHAARLQQLVTQGAARRVAWRADPHGYVELYESHLFHDLPFLALTQPPPPMYSLVVNGDPAGSVLRISAPAQAAVMDATLMALPYRLLPSQPNVLLIGETGGTNVWLARRRHAARVDVVQPDAAVVALVREFGGGVYDDARVSLHVGDPRAFLRSAREPRYDLIQLVALEGLGSGSTGVRGLAEDHLVTVEGVAQCLRALYPDGLIAVSRGVEQPPRENIRLLATFVAALESLGVRDAAAHVFQVRDYLGVCTIAARSPLTETRRAALRLAIGELNLTPVWYAGLPPEEVNQPDTLDGPPGTSIDWLHYAAREILSSRRSQFYDSWLLNVRPVHEDNPFFWDFYKPQAISELRRAYGDLWLTRAELGRLFLYVSLLVAVSAAVLLILLPLGVMTLRGRGRLCATAVSAVADAQSTAHRAVAPGTRGTPVFGVIVYFGGIGLGFMGLEMALISRATAWLGDPVIASALVIGAMLALSGVGSLTAVRVVGRRLWLGPLLVASAAVILRASAWSSFDGADSGLGPLMVTALVAAFVMGLPMPAGIAALNERAPRLTPWAWGINGVASVIATSAALAIAMSAGYRTVVALAAAAYALAALAAAPLNASRWLSRASIMPQPGALG